MYRKRGLYVFPDGEKIRLFAYNGEAGTEYAETTFAHQLIDFLEIDMSMFCKALNNLKSYNDNEISVKQLGKIFGSIGFLADSFCKDNPVYSFLLSNELLLFEKKDGYDTWETAISRKNKGIDILEMMPDLQTLMFSLNHVYCTTDGTHAEKVYKVTLGRGAIFNCLFEEIISVTQPKKTMFQMTDFSYPFTKGYRFDTLKDYMWFIFINTLQYDVNLSMCRYCGHFFIPKTKKHTHYCDRVRTSDGRTCKNIGPAFIKKLNAEHSVVLSEYDKAINRNFKRVERFEDKLSDEKTGKDLDYNDYTEWHRKVYNARQQWKKGNLSDLEFLKIIHELD